MGSGNWKIPYVVNNLITVYKQTFWAYPLPKSNFLSFYSGLNSWKKITTLGAITISLDIIILSQFIEFFDSV